MEKIVEWLAHHQLPCTFKLLFGIDCPTCGFQSSLIFLLRGDIRNSLLTYPALIPTLLFILLSSLYALTKIPDWKWVKGFMVFDLSIIFISYFARLIF